MRKLRHREIGITRKRQKGESSSDTELDFVRRQ